MEKEELKKIFSEFWGIPPKEINSEFKLDSSRLPGSVSIKLFQFFAKLETEYKVKIKEINKVLTFGDLYKNIEKRE